MRDKFNAYEYSDDLDMFADHLDWAVIKNMPCYSLTDMKKLFNVTNYSSMDFGRFFMKSDTISIQTSNYRGAKHDYVLATPAMRKLVHENVLFAVIKGQVNKAPKLHKKNVHLGYVKQIYKNRKEMMRVRDAHIIKDIWRYGLVEA
jgi:hypothetical protein